MAHFPAPVQIQRLLLDYLQVWVVLPPLGIPTRIGEGLFDEKCFISLFELMCGGKATATTHA